MTELKITRFLELRNAARDLNNETEALNMVWNNLEAELKSLNLGLEARVPVPDRSEKLAHMRGLKGWGLYMTDPPYETHPTPIEHAPRMFRVAAVDAIEPLVQALTQEAEKAVKTLNKHIKTVRTLTEEVK